MVSFNRQVLVSRFHDMIRRGEHIVGGGAGTISERAGRGAAVGGEPEAGALVGAEPAGGEPGRVEQRLGCRHDDLGLPRVDRGRRRRAVGQVGVPRVGPELDAGRGGDVFLRSAPVAAERRAYDGHSMT